MSYDLDELLAKLKDFIRNLFEGAFSNVRNWISEVYYDISSEIWGAIDWIGDKMEDAYSSVKSVITDGYHYVTDYVYAVINDVSVAIGRAVDYMSDALKGALGRIKDGISSLASKVWEGIEAAGEYVYAGISNLASGIGSSISSAVDSVRSFLSSQWTLISGFWGGVIGDIKNWLAEKLDALWSYFVKVIIPALMDAFTYVLESDVVKWLVALFEEHILSALQRLVDIDAGDLRKWIKDSFGLMQELAMEIRE